MKRLLLLASLVAPAAQAATFTVTRTDDPAANGCLPADCSLREALAAAQASAGADTVSLPAGNFVLTGGLPYITEALAVEGQGSASTSIASNTQVFRVDGTSFTLRNLALRDVGGGGVPALGGALQVHAGDVLVDAVEIRRAKATGLGIGGAIFAEQSRVEIRNSVLSQNYANLNGGAIALQGSSLRLTQGTQLRDNEAGYGGAIDFRSSTGNDTVVAEPGVQISYNYASNTGGALYGGTVDLRASDGSGLVLMEGNSAGVGGGAVHANGRATLAGVHLAANSTIGSGEGIVRAAAVTISDSYFDFNQSAAGGALVVTGGNTRSYVDRTAFRYNRALSADSASAMTLREAAVVYASNVDFYDNHGGTNRVIDNAGRLYLNHISALSGEHPLAAIIHQRGGNTTVSNSLIGGSCSGTLANISSAGGNQPITLPAFSTRCPLTATGDRAPAAAGTLGVIRATGGGRFPVTVIKVPTSPLVDRGLTSLCSPEDVRGRLRPAACDIGAFEYGAQ